MDDCADVEKRLGIVICKNLFLCDPSKENYYLLMMPGEKRFNTREVSKKLCSKRLSFADETSMEKYLNITPGSVSVLGLMYDYGNRVKLLIDRDILVFTYIGCHPCVNTSSLKILLSDLLERFLPAVGHEPTIIDL